MKIFAAMKNFSTTCCSREKLHASCKKFSATKNPDGLLTVGKFFCVKPRLVVEDIFQSLDVHVAIELRKIRRELD